MLTTKLELVQNILRENILDGTLKPGTRLVIRQLAQELGVSQIPIREAIRSLEAQGLVTMVPHSGAHVSTLNVDEIHEIMELRSVLEGYGTRTVIPIKAEVVLKLKECMEAMRVCVSSGNVSEFGKLNRNFHNIIYDQITNKKLYKLINETLHASERTRAVFKLSINRAKESLKEHEAILEALLAGDSDNAEDLVRAHRKRVGQIIIESINENREILPGSGRRARRTPDADIATD